MSLIQGEIHSDHELVRRISHLHPDPPSTSTIQYIGAGFKQEGLIRSTNGPYGFQLTEKGWIEMASRISSVAGRIPSLGNPRIQDASRLYPTAFTVAQLALKQKGINIPDTGIRPTDFEQIAEFAKKLNLNMR